jgi:hypothetical protein
MTGKPASDLGKHISVRLNQAIIDRADALIPTLTTPWHTANRSDVLRAVILAGLDVLEAEHRRRP